MMFSHATAPGWRTIAVSGTIAIACAVGSCTSQTAPDLWWPGYGNGPDNSRYFASKQIDKSNVARLEVAWTYPHGDTGSGPVVVRGVIYGRGRNGSLVAVDASSGKELWVRENMNGMTSRGINYWESADGDDQRLIFSMDSLLQEVDAKTGTSIMSFGTNGVVDLRVGIDGRDPATIGSIQSNTPGEVFENLIVLGSAPGEGYMSPPGDIRAYDVITGELVWTFHTVPRPGEFGYDTWPEDAYKYAGGNNNWGELTIDTELGIAFIPLGSPTYDFYGADRPGANLFGTSLVALDVRTGERLWHFQMVHHDLWDMDPNSAPQLTSIRHDGQSRDVVVAAGKTGWLYVFDRQTGEPIWPFEERQVPQSQMEGEESWPTQPYAGNPPPFIKQTFGVEDISPYLPVDEADAFRERLLAASNEGIFTPLGRGDTVQVPTHNGGSLFNGTAVGPEAGAFYVVAHHNPGIIRLLTPEEKAGANGPAMSPGQQAYVQHCQLCHGEDRLGTETGVALITAVPDPENSLEAGIPLFDAAAIRAILATGSGRMPPFPHLDASDIDDLVAFLARPSDEPAADTAVLSGSGAPADLVVGSGSAWTRPPAPPGSDVVAPPYPEGTPPWQRYVINEYHTVAYRIKPPFTSIVKYNLNEPRIEWNIGFGDDPGLASRGITGTGVPGLLNSIVVTESGIVFGAGGDRQIRAWDSDTGEQLWSARFGGEFVGTTLMYQVDGKPFLLVPAAGATPDSGTAPADQAGDDAATSPSGWVAYSLPDE